MINLFYEKHCVILNVVKDLYAKMMSTDSSLGSLRFASP